MYFSLRPKATSSKRTELSQSIGKLAIAGERAGFTIAEMISLLSAGLTVEVLIDLISARLEAMGMVESESPMKEHRV